MVVKKPQRKMGYLYTYKIQYPAEKELRGSNDERVEAPRSSQEGVKLADIFFNLRRIFHLRRLTAAAVGPVVLKLTNRIVARSKLPAEYSVE